MLRAIPLILLLSIVALADGRRAEFPRVPPGFDEGRVAFIKELDEGNLTARQLVERLFEHADHAELVAFIAGHFSDSERALLDAELKLEGKLRASRDAAAVADQLQELPPPAIVSAIGEMLTRQEYSLREAGAWLAARNFNFRTLQAALNGERIDGMRLRRLLRAQQAAEQGAHELFQVAMWQFDLRDGRLDRVGHYDGVQLIESLLALGWTEADFTRALGGQALEERLSALIRWGDPALIYPAMELRAPESELYRTAHRHHQTRGDLDNVLRVALLRAGATTRWFRTGGRGFSAVYEGPFPDGDGKPLPPSALVRGMEDELEISRELSAHFAGEGPRLVVAVYDDGSSRAMLLDAVRPANFGPASPSGNAHARCLFLEGRLSATARSGMLRPVYGKHPELELEQIEVVNVQLRAQGALLIADLDDGLELTPILLRRTSRLLDAPPLR